ncbi:MAG: dodecin family protein [bacterium]|nr:dodecin family protein [bacterium]
MSRIKKKLGRCTQNTVTEASKSIRNIRSVYIKDFNAEVDKKGKITHWRLNCKISFELDGNK